MSRWLFIGQLAASTGFVLCSWLLGSWVFVVTNPLMLATGAEDHFKSEGASIMGKYLLGWILGVPVFVLVIVYVLFN